MFEDIVYYTSLLVSISVGCYYKAIDNRDVKKHYATGLGILIALLICGHYLYHTILMVWLNTVILRCCDRRYVHIVSLVYTWIHLFYIHICLNNAYYVVMLHQNIALRLVGMAFEMYAASTHSLKPSSSLRIKSNLDVECVLDSSTSDVISYAFCFIGLHRGPYFRYKVYFEHLKAPFGSLGEFRQITEHKLKKMFLSFIALSLLQMKFSTQIFFENSFYDYNAEIRYLYNAPFLLIFVLQNSMNMLLCTCVCTEAGFGVYPAKTLPMPGHGPSARHSLLNVTLEQALQQEYNFSMLKSYDIEGLMIGPRMIDTVRNWDIPTRYWFWKNINKNLTAASKEIRSACSFLAWAVWSGASLQTMIISCTLWVYIHIESEYNQLYNTTGQMKMAWDIGFSIMRMFCLIYLTPCFIISDASIVIKYYYSIFWVFHAILFVLIIGAIVIHKSRSFH